MLMVSDVVCLQSVAPVEPEVVLDDHSVPMMIGFSESKAKVVPLELVQLLGPVVLEVPVAMVVLVEGQVMVVSPLGAR